jgi:hypothetical protein
LGEGIEASPLWSISCWTKKTSAPPSKPESFFWMERLECTWTGTTLRDSFDVDHVIPFDLWHNNDVWNLLPASKTANSKKSNKLPSTDILRLRKDCIVGYLGVTAEQEQSAVSTRKLRRRLVMPQNNWQNALYGQMCNAIEVTALQRGVGRWPMN